MKKLILTICILSTVTGCVTETASDGKKTVRIDAEKAEQFEKGTEAGAAIMTALAPVWPPAAGLAVGLLTALAAWRKQKGKLVIAQTETRMYSTVTESIVKAIEVFKEGYPTEWAILKDELTDKIGPKGEAIIHALRKTEKT